MSESLQEFPEEITEKEYQQVRSNKDNYEDWYVGLVGFCATFGAKFFGGYGREKDKNDNTKKRNISSERIRNIKKQAPNLKNIHFKCCSFLDINKVKGYVIYCDPPYRGTTKYSTDEFPYEDFYAWCRDMAKNNVVLVSEYDMPNDFKCIWEKEHYVGIHSNKKFKDDNNKRIERLFICP